MKLFEQRELHQALEHVRQGGQSLHRHRMLSANAPACFVRDVRAGKAIGHLFDQDIDRLYRTVRDLGVRQVLIEHPGEPRQHVDLCGLPMKKAVAMATNQGKEYAPCPT